MTETEITRQLASYLGTFFEQEGNQDHFLVEMEQKGKRLEVYLDSDSGITFDICKKVSRYLESYLDESGMLGEDYLLEVSSAGVGRPLLWPRQYRKNIGRNLQVTLGDGTVQQGALTVADDDTFTIEWTTREKQGKKNVNVQHKVELAYAEIRKAIIKLTTP
jgi:ribosome maturation factor RimP